MDGKSYGREGERSGEKDAGDVGPNLGNECEYARYMTAFGILSLAPTSVRFKVCLVIEKRVNGSTLLVEDVLWLRKVWLSVWPEVSQYDMQYKCLLHLTSTSLLRQTMKMNTVCIHYLDNMDKDVKQETARLCHALCHATRASHLL
jgi:hypothetical protein